MEENEDDNIKQFPDAKARQHRVVLRAANDGGSIAEPMVNLPPAVKYLCLALVLAYIAQIALPYLMGVEQADFILYSLGFVPARYTGGMPAGIAAIVSPVTHFFLHGGWLHLGVNVLTLMAFGAGLEKWMGARRMLLIFFLSGLAGAGAQLALTPDLVAPLIGASGAISGLFGALLVEMHARGVMQGEGRKPLFIFTAVWILTSLFFGTFGVPGAEGAISWATHIGGFLAGMLLAKPMGKLNL